MSEGLKSLKKIINKTDYYFPNFWKVNMKELDNIEKELEALEIIKEKRVDTRAFIEILEDEWTWEQYMDEEDDINTGGHQFSRDRLTQEEYNLLKEVLKL